MLAIFGYVDDIKALLCIEAYIHRDLLASYRQITNKVFGEIMLSEF